MCCLLFTLVEIPIGGIEVPKSLGPSQLCPALPTGAPDPAASISLEARGQEKSGRN